MLWYNNTGTRLSRGKMLVVDSDLRLMAHRRKSDAVTAYIPPDLKRELETWATEDSRTVSGLIVFLLRRAVKERQNKSDSD